MDAHGPVRLSETYVARTRFLLLLLPVLPLL